MVAAKTPSEDTTEARSTCEVRVRTCPTGVQWTRSRLWNTGMPGKYSKVEVTR